MKQKLLLTLFLFSVFAHAQNQLTDFAAKERAVRKLLTSRPDSARVHLREILNHRSKLHDTMYAAAHIFYGYSHYLQSNLDSAMLCYNKALTYANNSPAHYAWALRNKAMVYRRRAEYQKALAILGQAVEKYQSLGKTKDIAIAYGEMAANYNMLLQSDEAIRYQLKAIDILEENNDTFFIYTVKQSLANTYMNMGNYEFAIELYEEVLKGFAANNSPKNHAITLLNYADCLISTGKPAPAKKALAEGIAALEKFNDAELVSLAFSKLARAEAMLGNPEKVLPNYEKAYHKALQVNAPRLLHVATEYIAALNAIKSYNEALSVISAVERNPVKDKANLKEKVAYEDEKAITYQNSHNEKQALAAIASRIELMDTLSKTVNDLPAIKMQQEYQSRYEAQKTSQLQKANTSLKEELSEKKMSRLLPFLALCSVLAAVVIIYTQSNYRHRQKLIAAKKDNLAILRKYQSHKKMNEAHKKQLGTKQGELVSGIAALATTEATISRLVAAANEGGQADIGSIKDNLQLLVTADNDYRKLFRKRFNEAHAGFQHNLQEKYPQLTKNDLFFCSLLKLKLSNKDMAGLMQVSPESIVKKKYRIKKRVGLESETELDTVLQTTPDVYQGTPNVLFLT